MLVFTLLSAFFQEIPFTSGRHSFVRQLYVIIKFCRTEQRIKCSLILPSTLCVPNHLSEPKAARFVEDCGGIYPSIRLQAITGHTPTLCFEGVISVLFGRKVDYLEKIDTIPTPH